MRSFQDPIYTPVSPARSATPVSGVDRILWATGISFLMPSVIHDHLHQGGFRWTRLFRIQYSVLASARCAIEGKPSHCTDYGGPSHHESSKWILALS